VLPTQRLLVLALLLAHASSMSMQAPYSISFMPRAAAGYGSDKRARRCNQQSLVDCTVCACVRA
jgi:hypothetical protein